MAATAAITMEGWGASANLQALYTSSDTDKLTTITVTHGARVRLYNRAGGATVVVQTQGVVQGAAPAADAAQLIQTGEMIVSAADCGCNPFAPWTFGISCPLGTANTDASLTAL